MSGTHKYGFSLTQFRRRRTCQVPVGTVLIGSDHPIVLQSMGTVDTNDAEACAAQAMRIAAAGGQMVRFTAQGMPQAQSLAKIRSSLHGRGCPVPLVADIHFMPQAALLAAQHVEKVRINPGNFIDRRADFSKVEYTGAEYDAELHRLEARLCELLEVCQTHGTALRIGVNHGSLSDRIMSRYGDTPAGMVESAMEFLRICRKYDFSSVVVSMKSSNTRVMVHAYRLLVAAMEKENMDYPLHLGVTEAGEGADGRIRSSVGIGALLADGLGDTIRVSLTEAPENEIPVAGKLARHFEQRAQHSVIPDVDEDCYFPYESHKRDTRAVKSIGGKNAPAVVMDFSVKTDVLYTLKEAETWETPPDWVYVGQNDPDYTGNIPLIYARDFDREGIFFACSIHDLTPENIRYLRRYPEKILVLSTDNKNGIAEQRAFFLLLSQHGLNHPVLIRRSYRESDPEDFQVKAAADTGMLFIDGFGDGLWLDNTREELPLKVINDTAFGILQASRARITRTEFISCPGCGRTLFDLQQTASRVRERTGHLKGLKIAVMGCIVNGPGEMADADYGYVGAGAGKVTLYRKKEVMRRNVPQEEAVETLVDLIKECGDWQ